MSNTEAANIYADIIEEVIAESRQDFENSGIDEATLQDLRKIWMEKLTFSQTAEFPWSNAKNEDGAEGEVDVGAEGINDDNSLALHANGNDLYPSAAVTQQQQSPLQQQSPSQQSLTTGLEYPTAGAGITAPKEESTGGLVLPTGGRIVNQGDGNFEITIEAETADEAMQILKNIKKRQRRKAKKAAKSNSKQQRTIPQADGIDSDDDDDDNNDDEDNFSNGGSDDINSDLDDSDALDSDNDSDDQEGNIMLCLYDKVQRVKSKWKCNLKEGIVNLNGKDYTFQKATSESEW